MKGERQSGRLARKRGWGWGAGGGNSVTKWRMKGQNCDVRGVGCNKTYKQ